MARVGLPQTQPAYVGLPQLAGQAQNSIGWLFDQSQPLNDTDWDTAASNLALGVSGSQFGENRGLVLRDAERRDRMEQANQMLQPFLERENQQTMQRNQLEAEAARQLVSEAGLDRRLTSQQQAALQLALLEGNQQAARQLVSEAGLNSRQAAQLESEMDRVRMTTSANLVQSLIGLAGRTSTGSGSSAAPAAPQGSYRWQTDYNTGQVIGGVPPPRPRPQGGGGINPMIASDVNRILQQYGLGSGAGGINLSSYF